MTGDPLQLPETGIEPRSLASQTNGYRPRTARHVYRAALLAAGVALVLAGVAVGRATATPRTAGIPVIGDGSFRLLEAPQQAVLGRVDSPSAGGASLPPAVGSHPTLEPIESMPATSSESGTATWYRDPSRSGYYAAAPWYSWGDKPERVTVCNRFGACIRAVVGDFCQCPGDRIIDLAPSAFERLAPLSRGIVAVTVSRGPSVTPPATDVTP